DAGPLGSIEPDGRVIVRTLRVPQAHRLRFDLGGLERLPRVDVVVTHVDADGTLVDAAVAAGARGVVAAGAGAGRPTGREYAALRRAAASGVVVCLSSRTGSGRVSRLPSVAAHGIIAADNLQPW